MGFDNWLALVALLFTVIGTSAIVYAQIRTVAQRQQETDKKLDRISEHIGLLFEKSEIHTADTAELTTEIAVLKQQCGRLAEAG